MAGIRQRKKNLILAGLAGALLTGLPLFGTTVFFTMENLAVRQQVEEYRRKEEGTEQGVLYILSTDKERGDILEQQDITAVEINGELSGIQVTALEHLVGRQLRTFAEAGTMISEGILAEEILPTEDQRRLELNYIRIPELLNQGELIDIRVHFENGEDYIVAGKKKVLTLQREDEYRAAGLIEIQVSEEEILKLASVKADYDCYENTLVYAVIYADDGQAQAKDTYPVNMGVYEISCWDPNVVKQVLTAENQQKRQILEENLVRFYYGEEETGANLLD